MLDGKYRFIYPNKKILPRFLAGFFFIYHLRVVCEWYFFINICFLSLFFTCFLRVFYGCFLPVVCFLCGVFYRSLLFYRCFLHSRIADRFL